MPQSFARTSSSFLLPLLLIVACSRADATRALPSEVVTNDNSNELSPYPAGRWRLLDPRELETVVLWVSHILIRHANSDMQVMGTVFDWRLEEPPPKRTRGEAIALAKSIASKLDAQPESFERLAREHSEDSTTRFAGGSLGGTRASDFRFEPEVLDVLAALKPEQTSRVAETRHGFHIFRRRPVPQMENVSGEHIVIGHDASSWLTLIGSPPPRRSRAEAFALARELHESALKTPHSFRELVSLHSDHPDRITGGDIGTWSVTDPSPNPRSLEALRVLPIGGLSPPIETHLGIEILRRTPQRTRPLYAMEPLRIAFSPNDAESKQMALELTEKLITSLEQDPARFDEFRRQYCCEQPEKWFEGQDEPGLSAAVAKLDLGAIADSPVEQYTAYVVPKRIDPADAPPSSATQFEIPSPKRPKLEWVLRRVPRQLLAKEVVALAELHPKLATTALQRAALQDIERSASHASISRKELVASIRALFGAPASAPYRVMLEERLGERLMRANSRANNRIKAQQSNVNVPTEVSSSR